MFTLLAESKTMATEQYAVSSSVFEQYTPVLESMADKIIGNLLSFNVAELAEIMKISHQLASKARNLAYDFANKSCGSKALYAFTGEAFRALDVNSMTSDALSCAGENLRIISSAYGILNPDDIIKPYRLEFNKPVAPGNTTPIKYLKPKVTIEFVKNIKEINIKEIINLLPADADACLDWKIIRAFSKVHKIVFNVIEPTGKLKTPSSRRLKELRGLMARTIFENNLQTFQELTTFESPHFIFSPSDSKPGLAVFISTD